MRFEQLSIEDGLSQSFVNCTFQDSTGFLWIGTQSGLNRYDGYGFKVYRNHEEDPASLAHDWILALLGDPVSGDLWIGTEGGGLARWQRSTDTFITYRHDPEDPNSLSGNSVVALAWDDSGQLWVGTRDSGLNRLNPETQTFQRFVHDPSDPGSLSSDRVFAAYVDRSGDLWVGTAGGLDRLDRTGTGPEGQAFVHYRHDSTDPSSLSDNRVRTIIEDSRGILWVGTHGGLNRLGEETPGAFERFLHDPSDPGSLSHDWVRALLEDSAGRLWVGTDGGLNLWQEESGSFADYHPEAADPDSLGSDQIVSIYEDRSGILWIAPVGAGLNRWNPGTWSFPVYASDDTGASNTVFAVSEDASGGLWVGTFGGGLERLDRATGQRTPYTHDPRNANSLSDDRVTALLHDRNGVLWIGTVGGGLNRLEGGAIEHYRHDPERPDSLSADGVTALFEDRSGRLWIGTLGGLDLLREDNTFTHFRHDSDDHASLANDRVFAMAEGHAGHLWLATDGGGLNRLHLATGAFLRLRHTSRDSGSLASDELLAVHMDAGGQLWVGTKSNGLDKLERFDEGTGRAVFKNYCRPQNLPDETVWGIRSDAGGDLWISTNNGLARLNPETEIITTYTVNHGLQSNEFNKGADFASPSGELFFGGVNGLNAFFPERIEANPHVPPVVVTSFTRTGQAVRFDRPIFDVETISLGYRDYFFSFEFAALDFTAPQENRYRYKLEGFDSDWIDLDHRRQVTFTNLDAGSYSLRLQGSNNDGVWNAAGTSVAIVVTPPPWKSWWAYSLYLLALAGIAGMLVQRQRREIEIERGHAQREREIARLERDTARRERARSEERRRLLEELGAKNDELERFNYTVSHDLKSPLVTIKGFLGLLEQDAERGDLKRLKHDVRRIGAAADRMRRLLDELLELSTVGRQLRPPEGVALSSLVHEALENLTAQISAGEVDVKVDPDLPTIVGDRVRILQLFQNLISNAVKYMGDQAAPRVEIGLRYDAATTEGDPAIEGEENERGTPVLYVRDNGQGIDQRYHERVFGLFERLDAGGEGTGVGLALAKRIVEMYGGCIWIESAGRGCGSSFCFTFDGLRAEDDDAAVEKTGTLVEAGDRFRKSEIS